MILRERASSKDVLQLITVVTLAVAATTPVCSEVVSHTLTNHVWVCCSTNVSTSQTSALSSQPMLLPQHTSSHHNAEIESHGSSTEPETEEEWLDSSQLAELARRFPSRMTATMAIEVCFSSFSLHLACSQLVFSGRHGMI